MLVAHDFMFVSVISSHGRNCDVTNTILYHDAGGAAAEFSAGALPAYLKTLIPMSR